MYKKNKRALQPLLLSDVNDLLERSREYLKSSWAETFRREVFLRIPEDRFKVLYDPDPSRPNVPVNVMVGFFDENFKLVENQVQAKSNTEIQPGCLQSLDDLEAGFRRKGNHSYKGFVGNVTETCDPDNPLQLITNVQVQSNRMGDIELLKQALPELKERMELGTLVTDGAYTGPSVDQALRAYDVEQITTGLIGALPTHPN